MKSIENMLSYAKSKHRRVGYSMAYPQRLGPYYLDCSSFVYYSLIAGGFLPKSTPIGNTETLYGLKGKIFKEIYSYDQIRPGDIFIRGMQGASAGAGGHTGIFTRKGEIIHCNAYNSTVTINNETSYISYYLACQRSDRERYFRPIGNEMQAQTHNLRMAKVHATTNVRVYPSTDAKVVATYHKGSTIYYDKIVNANNYGWLSYIGQQSGERRYVAYRYKNQSWMTL